MSLLATYNNLLRPIRLIPAFVRGFAGTGDGTSTFTVTHPTPPVDGNLMVIMAGGQQARNIVTPPSGFTSLFQQGTVAIPTNRIWYKFATASEPSSYSIVWSGALTGLPSFAEVSNIDKVNPILFHYGTGSNVAVTTLPLPAYNVNNPGIAFTFVGKSSTGTWGPDNDFTNIPGAGSNRKQYKIYYSTATNVMTTWSGTSETINADIIFFNGKVLGYTP